MEHEFARDAHEHACTEPALLVEHAECASIMEHCWRHNICGVCGGTEVPTIGDTDGWPICHNCANPEPSDARLFLK